MKWKLKRIGTLSASESWFESWLVVVLALGFILGMGVRSRLGGFLVLFFCGLVLGRSYYRGRKKTMWGFITLVSALASGYLLAASGSGVIDMFGLVLGVWCGNRVHELNLFEFT